MPSDHIMESVEKQVANPDVACQHNFDRLNLTHEKNKLKISIRRLRPRIYCVEEKIDDIDFFFAIFGDSNRGNVATHIMDKYNERKLKKQAELANKLLDLETQMNNCHQRSRQLDEEAMLQDCPCIAN